jgi:hypothetical protein
LPLIGFLPRRLLLIRCRWLLECHKKFDKDINLRTRDELREAQLKREGQNVYVYTDLFIGSSSLQRGDVCKLSLLPAKAKKRAIVYAKIVEYWAKPNFFGTGPDSGNISSSTIVKYEREPSLLFYGTDSSSGVVLESCKINEICVENGKAVKVTGPEITKMKEQQAIHKIELITRIYREGAATKHDDGRLVVSTDKAYAMLGYQLLTRDSTPTIGVRYPQDSKSSNLHMSYYVVTATLIMDGGGSSSGKSTKKGKAAADGEDSAISGGSKKNWVMTEMWIYDPQQNTYTKYVGKEVCQQ